LSNLTIVGSELAGVFAVDGCTADVRGSIVWDSTGTEISGTASVAYSLVQGGYAGEGNTSSDPLFEGYPAFTGDWSDVYFDEALFQTELTDDTASWEPGELAGLIVNVYAGYYSTVIADNTETVLWAWGNTTTYATTGDPYEILDLHLQAGSPAIDSGYGANASDLDVEGNSRYDDPGATNAYDCGTSTDCLEYVDMGAYERQP
jgi:hypothetical protein